MSKSKNASPVKGRGKKNDQNNSEDFVGPQDDLELRSK